MSNKTQNQHHVETEEVSVHIGIPDARGKRRSPWAWVGTMYYAEGIPYILAMTVSVIMYKKMGISNTDIAYYTSLLYLPWVIKPLWSPIVDILKTKRWWIVVMQLCLGAGMLGVALTIPLPNFFRITLTFFWIIAFCSATHDIACDGFYMLGLSRHQQAWFVGVRATFYRFAMLTGQGLLVIFAGWIESKTGLEAVTIKVEAVAEAPASAEIVKLPELTPEEQALLDNKSSREKLEFYVNKVKTAKTLSEAATYAKLADKLVAEIKNTHPADPELPELSKIATTATDALHTFILNLMETKQQAIKPLEGDLRIIANPQTLQIPLTQISKTDSDLTLSVIQQWNKLQGQKTAEAMARAAAKKEPGVVKKFWSKNVATPLANFLRKHWGAEKKESAKVAGNIGYVYFHLSKPPEPGKQVTVAFGRRSGDKSIELKEGMSFIFDASNWNKPAVALIQLDYRLKDSTSAVFRATAGNIPLSWTVTFFLIASLFFLFSVYHYFILPHPVADTSRSEEARRQGKPLRVADFFIEFFRTFVSFFQKKGIVPMILFLCLYRFAEAQLVKLSSPFLLDSQEAGGLALTTGQVGFAYGTIGLICLSLGGILGGMVAARDGLKKWLWPMALAINVPDLLYVFLSQVQPESFLIVCLCVGLETLGYGFGFTAYMLYMIFVAEGKYKTAHFAICTGFMALGMMIPGMFSGWIQSIIGYKNFFIWIMISTIPSFLVLLFIPLDPEFGKKKAKQQGN